MWKPINEFVLFLYSSLPCNMDRSSPHAWFCNIFRKILNKLCRYSIWWHISLCNIKNYSFVSPLILWEIPGKVANSSYSHVSVFYYCHLLLASDLTVCFQKSRETQLVFLLWVLQGYSQGTGQPALLGQQRQLSLHPIMWGNHTGCLAQLII